eukprot:6191222-Pleurochrysis_carterae.AAC.1
MCDTCPLRVEGALPPGGTQGIGDQVRKREVTERQSIVQQSKDRMAKIENSCKAYGQLGQNEFATWARDFRQTWACVGCGANVIRWAKREHRKGAHRQANQGRALRPWRPLSP